MKTFFFTFNWSLNCALNTGADNYTSKFFLNHVVTYSAEVHLYIIIKIMFEQKQLY